MRIRTGLSHPYRQPLLPSSSQPAWVQLALRINASDGLVDDYRTLMSEISDRQGQPYRDRRYRNLHIRDRRLYRQLVSQQREREEALEQTLSRRLPPELIRIINNYSNTDAYRTINRITNRRQE